MPKRFAVGLVTGTATGVAPGSVTMTDAANSIFLGNRHRKIADLSCLITALAETNTITLGARWQGSNDQTTWFTCAHAPQNPATVVLGTGTAGADAAVTRSVEAPPGVYSYQYARCVLEVGVVTGTASDTWSRAYNYYQREVADPQ